MPDKRNYEQLEKYRDELKAKLAERKSIGENLKESHSLYQSLFEHAGVAMVLIDMRTGKVAAFNKKAHEDLQYTGEEFKKLKFEDYILPRRIEREHYVNNLRDNNLMVYESKLKRKDGTVMDVYRSAVTLKIAGKRYLHSIRFDITEQKKTERLLRDSEKRYREILEDMEAGYYEVDLAGNLMEVNPAFSRFTGYPEDELIGMNNREYMTPETAKKVYGFFNALYQTGRTPTPTFEYEVITKAGTIAIADISVSLVKNPQGETTGFRGIVREITERKKAQKALEEQEVLYRTLFDHAGFGMTLTDAKTGKRVAINRKAYEDLGYTEEEYKKLSPRDLFVSTEEEYADIIGKVLDKGSHTYEMKLRGKNGEIRDFFRSSVKVKINGKTYMHGIRVDVTERKKTEEKLKESEARFRSIFETAADAIFLIDLDDMEVIDANQAACNLLGCRRDEIIGMSLLQFVQYTDQGHFDEIRTGLITSEPQLFEAAYLKKDKTAVDAEVSTCLTQYQGKQVVLTIARDVTERKKTEAELETYQKNLEAMVKERTKKLELAQKELIRQEKLAVLGQLTATVSHELRNPLGVIQSSNYYLQRKVKEPDDKIQKHLRRVEEQVDICDTIVADLLEYTRGNKSELSQNDINAWLPDLLDQLSESEKIPIHVTLLESIPPFFHDPVKMRQVILNLLKNAIQAVQEKVAQSQSEKEVFTPKIKLSVLSKKDRIIFLVEDNGVGMEDVTLEKAIEPLFTTRDRGTGLGLANVHKIISDHCGEIALTSKPGKGTKVSITLPYSTGDNGCVPT